MLFGQKTYSLVVLILLALCILSCSCSMEGKDAEGAASGIVTDTASNEAGGEGFPDGNDNTGENTDIETLRELIDTARRLYCTVSAGNSEGQVTYEAYSALEEAGREGCRLLAGSPSAAEISDALKTLAETIEAFEASIRVTPDFSGFVSAFSSLENVLAENADAVSLEELRDEALAVYRAQNSSQGDIDALAVRMENALKEYLISKPVDTEVIKVNWKAENGASFRETDGITSVRLPSPGSMIYSVVNPSNMSFDIRINESESFTWLGITFSNNGATRLNANGFTAVLYLDTTIEARMVESVAGTDWDVGKPLSSLMISSIKSRVNDGRWHNITLKQTGAGWSFTIDGEEMFEYAYSDADYDLTRLLTGKDVTLTLYTDGASANIEVRQVTD